MTRLASVLLALLLTACGAAEAQRPLPRVQTEIIDQIQASLAHAERDARYLERSLGARVEQLRRIEAPADHRLLIEVTARRHGLQPDLLAAVGGHESDWDKDAEGIAADTGWMQVLVRTAEWIATMRGIQHYDLRDPATNLDFGAWYLRWCLDSEGGDVFRGLQCYNGGPAWETEAPLDTAEYARAVLARLSH